MGNYREPADEIELSPPFPENVRDKPVQCFLLVTVLSRKFDLNLKNCRKLLKMSKKETSKNFFVLN